MWLLAGRIAENSTEIEALTAKISALLASDEAHGCLLTVPGIGPRTASELVVSVDIAGFPGHDRLASYCGLARLLCAKPWPTGRLLRPMQEQGHAARQGGQGAGQEEARGHLRGHEGQDALFRLGGPRRKPEARPGRRQHCQKSSPKRQAALDGAIGTPPCRCRRFPHQTNRILIVSRLCFCSCGIALERIVREAPPERLRDLPSAKVTHADESNLPHFANRAFDSFAIRHLPKRMHGGHLASKSTVHDESHRISPHSKR